MRCPSSQQLRIHILRLVLMRHELSDAFQPATVETAETRGEETRPMWKNRCLAAGKGKRKQLLGWLGDSESLKMGNLMKLSVWFCFPRQCSSLCPFPSLQKSKGWSRKGFWNPGNHLPSGRLTQLSENCHLWLIYLLKMVIFMDFP